MTPTLETPRLWLRPLELADAEQCQVLFPQWEIVRYLRNGFPWPLPPDASFRNIHDDVLPAVERGEEWHWSLRLKTAPDQLIGRISLHKGNDNNRGFWLGLAAARTDDRGL
jgi:hypothetical protein